MAGCNRTAGIFFRWKNDRNFRHRHHHNETVCKCERLRFGHTARYRCGGLLRGCRLSRRDAARRRTGTHAAAALPLHPRTRTVPARQPRHDAEADRNCDADPDEIGSGGQDHFHISQANRAGVQSNSLMHGCLATGALTSFCTRAICRAFEKSPGVS